MALFDELPVPKPAAHVLGEDLSRLSIDELRERMRLLQAEIGRISEAIEAKTASKQSAAQFFKI